MLALPNTAGKTYAVLGLGKSGLTTAQALQASGTTVLAWDDTAASRDKAAALGITCTAWEQIDWTKITALI
ncbi:MAG: UDP-N-acetylmuramoyl-L-alanine--D-glutamate ligase, partial [Alphaproteobacteria bacterium]|nr:UDP-N-acetylmuramoyl-L-alanine--D-glutamate ligase [Alphaproteobacteria bacterium]